MKKAFLLLLFLLCFAGIASAQVGNTVTTSGTGAPPGGANQCSVPMFYIENSSGNLYDCKAGVWNSVAGGGGGGSPASPSGSIQYNNAGSFGALSEWANGNADCDTFGDPCDVFITSSSTFRYFLAGTNSNGAAGNFMACYQFTDAGVYCNSTDTTDNANLDFAPSDGNTGMSVLHAGKATGFFIHQNDRVVTIGRLAFSSNFTTTPTSMLFALSAGWGSTAAVSSIGGSDNSFIFTVTTGGSGIAANPTVTYTYADGSFGGASIPIALCLQTGGTDVIADITNAPTNTNIALTWHGTPTTAKTYIISCHLFQRS